MTRKRSCASVVSWRQLPTAGPAVQLGDAQLAEPEHLGRGVEVGRQGAHGVQPHLAVGRLGVPGAPVVEPLKRLNTRSRKPDVLCAGHRALAPTVLSSARARTSRGASP